VAEQNGLPAPLLMNLLKRLHRSGLVRSVRGARGGYRIGGDLDDTSLFDLMEIVTGRAPSSTCQCGHASHDDLRGRRAMHVPMQALQYRLVRFLKDVKLSDLIVPGRRIDVPREVLAEQCSCRIKRPLPASIASGSVVVEMSV
jgi:Rrf2 family protein